MAYGAGYDTAKPMAALNAQKSATGYDLYHKTFSSAMQHAYKFAKSKGFTVSTKDIDDKVASGPRKPSAGKTNSYILDTDKNKRVHIQVGTILTTKDMNLICTLPDETFSQFIKEEPRIPRKKGQPGWFR